MRALILKDLMLIRLSIKIFAIVLIGVSAIYILNNQDWTMVNHFLRNYIFLFCMILTMGLFRDDDPSGDKGYVLCLPTTRKSYVYSRYLLSIGCIFVAGLVSSVFQLVLHIKTGQLGWYEYGSIYAMFVGYLAFIAFYWPIVLRFGKMKAFNFVFVGVVFAMFFFLGMVGGNPYLREFLIDFATKIAPFFQLPYAVLLAIASVTVLVLLLLSLQISKRIIAKQEF